MATHILHAVHSKCLIGHTNSFFLQKVLNALLDYVLSDINSRIWFQKDGTPVHLSSCLGPAFIGLGGSDPWTPTSAHLTCFDCFFWRTIQSLVHENSKTFAEDLAMLLLEMCFLYRCSWPFFPTSFLN